MHPVKNIEEGETEREEVPDILKKKIEEVVFDNFSVRPIYEKRRFKVVFATSLCETLSWRV